MSEQPPEEFDKMIDIAEESRRRSFIQLLMRDAAPMISRFDGQEAISTEAVIRSLLERAYDGGAEHAVTLPGDLTHEPKHRKEDDEGENDD